MWKPWVGCIALALVAGSAHAEDKKPPVTKAKVVPGKDFWKILVKPKAKWVIKNEENKTATVTVETYDVRKVGDADVARLRWTYKDGAGQTEDIGATESGKPTQVAVTEKGLYLLNAKNDDTAVAKRLAEKPSRSSPPKAYAGTKKNGGRYLQINADGAVCWGEAPVEEDFECPDICDAWVCVSPTDGVVELHGLWAPGQASFSK